ncbi:MAG: D-alanyl-D-alanine carboxypeptidase/D-alanyl-D-alanine-endopeptidase [Polyangiaceae bacterium]
MTGSVGTRISMGAAPGSVRVGAVPQAVVAPDRQRNRPIERKFALPTDTRFRYAKDVPTLLPSSRIIGLAWVLCCGGIGCSSSAAIAAEPKRTQVVAQAQVPRSPLTRLSRWVETRGGKLSVSVAEADSGRAVLSLEGGVPRNPASVTKLVTAKGALKVLGPTFTFETTIHGVIADGRIERLVLRGGGDPTVTTNDLRSTVDELLRLGLSSGVGDVVVDQSAFDDPYVPPAYEQQPNEWAAFRAPVCAMAVDRNRVRIRVYPTRAGAPARVVVDPLGYVIGDFDIATVAGRLSEPKVTVQLEPVESRLRVRVRGNIGERDGVVTLERRVDDPRAVAGYVLRELLRERGIQVRGSVDVVRGSAEGLPVLVSRRSAPVATLLAALGKDSDNFTAEMLLLAVGKSAGAVGSSDAGAKVLLEDLARLGPLEPGTRIINGSGLFDANRLSTDLLVRVLVAQRADASVYPEYVTQLATSARDGTLRHRLTGLPNGCVIRAKTGSLRGTSSLSGYVARPEGVTLAFGVIVEGIADMAAPRPEIDAFVASLCLGSPTASLESR